MEETIEFPLWGKIIGFLLNLLVVVLNSIEIHILRTTPKKPFYEKILLSLTISDLINGIFGCVGAVLLSVFEKKIYYDLFWNIAGYGVCYSALISLLHLIFISLDRLWAVHSPFHHRTYSLRKKLTIALISSWGLPMLFMVANIVFISIQKLTIKEVYQHLLKIVYGAVAKVIFFADVIFLFSYSAIIWTTLSRKLEGAQEHQKQQKRFGTTLILCMSIVLIFILSTTPFTVAFLINWNRPGWFVILSSVLFILNAISNSIVFLVQKHRVRKANTFRRDVSESSGNQKIHDVNCQ